MRIAVRCLWTYKPRKFNDSISVDRHVEKHHPLLELHWGAHLTPPPAPRGLASSGSGLKVPPVNIQNLIHFWKQLGCGPWGTLYGSPGSGVIHGAGG